MQLYETQAKILDANNKQPFFIKCHPTK